MRRSPTFSVVIPTFNRLGLLKQALSSVWAQSYGDYEIIVVDDGSADGTIDYLVSVGERVRALQQRNSGPAAARNLGSAQATGVYIAFLDSDDLWLPWTLATYNSLIHMHEPSLLSAAVVEFRDSVPALEEGPLHADHFRDYLDTARQPGFIGSGTLVIKRSEFQRAGGFDESMTIAEDHDFYFRVGSAPGFVRVLSPITLMYRRHEESTSKCLPAACASAIAILKKEAGGCYPGGNERQMQRWLLLSRMLRPIALLGVKAGVGLQAWQLYCRSFWMNAWLGRFRFLIGFMVFGLLSLLRSRQ